MCGIAGIFHYRSDEPVDRGVLERMTRALVHRGPDAEGFFFDGPLGFGHRRLSIVDLSETGAQPMHASDPAVVITNNGELYDHAEHRARLEGRGVRFRGRSDTETLVNLVAHEGPDALARVAGIFAFAVWDARARRLLLARDPLGVKQLYYVDDGARLYFASEMKALMHVPALRPELDAQALNEYLHFHTPLFERTFFRDVRQVRPAEYLEVDAHGPRAHVYWTLDGFDPDTRPPAVQVEELRHKIRSVVESQLMADVPVGCFFSGGIDSTAVAAYAARAGAAPKCFGVHFSNTSVIDERPYQEATARALGVELSLITVDDRSFADDMQRLIVVQDQPVIGAAMLPMYYVSKLAAAQVKACLGGQAADEIFAGYARYALAQPGRVARHWLRHRGAAREGDVGVGGNLRKQLFDPRTLRRVARVLKHPLDWRRRYFDNFAPVHAAGWREVFSGDVAIDREAAWGTFADRLARSAAPDPSTKLMQWDSETYLTGLFQQDDRMSMSVSLESRVPLADPRLVRHAFHIDFDLKFREGASKWILRQAVADVVPREVLTRRKVGFDTPAETWMATSQAGFVRDVLTSSRARARGLWNTPALERLLDEPRAHEWFGRVWKALCIELWASHFLDGEAARKESHAA